MAQTLNFFDSIDHLEPKCPGCGTLVEWGTNTIFDEEKESHICSNCGFVFSQA